MCRTRIRRRNQKHGIMSDNTQRRGKTPCHIYIPEHRIYIPFIGNRIAAIVENFMVRGYNESNIN